ncbi:MAG: DUF481 domain-containing protein [Opitutales bacterium]|jgi:hypothetical protein
MKHRQTITLVIAVLSFSASGFGATVELANGYKLEGEIVGRDENSVQILSPVMGRIDVPMSNVANIVEDAPAAGDVPAADVQEVASAPATSSVQTVAEPAVEAVSQDGRITTFLRRINFLRKWKTDLSLGLSVLSGQTNSRSTSVAFSTERKWETQELRFAILQQYEVTSRDTGGDDVTRDMFKLTGRYRQDISERIFWQSETQYSYDNVKRIDTDLRESLGVGWRVIEGDKLNITLTPALTMQYQVVQGEDTDITYSPTLFEELTYDWTADTSLRQELSALFPVNGDSDPSYHFSLDLKHKLGKYISANLLYIYDYDGSMPAGLDANQQSLNVMLGVTF